MTFTLNTNDINDTIAELSSSLKELEDVASDVGDMAIDLLPWNWGELKEDWENLKKDSEEFVNEIKDTIKCLKKIVKLALDYAEDAMKKVKEKFGEAITYIDEKIDGAIEFVTDVIEDVGAFIVDCVEVAVEWTGYLVGFLWEEVIQRVVASIANFTISLVKGILEFGEAIIDFAAILGTCILSLFTGIGDLCQWINSCITGSEWESYTKNLWAIRMDFVKEEWVKGVFDGFYDNTSVGQWLDDKAYEPFKSDGIMCSIGEGIGYIGGVILLALATGGTSLSGQAAIAGAAGIGSGTEDSWNDGKGVLEGLGYGTVNGIWEAAQWYVGGKIATAEFGVTNRIVNQNAQKFAQSSIRISLDTLTGAAEQPFRTMMDAWANDMSLSEAWEENGGWEGLLTQAGIGFLGSAGGEIFDLRKYFKNSENNIDNNIKADVDIDKKMIDLENEIIIEIEEFNKLMDIKNSPEYQQYLIDIEKGYATLLGKDGVAFANLETRLNKLETSINNKKDEYASLIKSNFNVTSKLNTTEKINTTTKVSNNIDTELDANTKNVDNYSQNEIVKIKQEILDSIPYDLDDVSKIRKIYIELNKRVNYDPNYLAAGRNNEKITQQNIIDSIKSFDDLDSNANVVCAGWSNLYQEALIAAGIDPNKVKIMTTSNNSHFWVEIDMEDYIIVADSTDAINHSTDLSNSKSNSSTNGFIILDKSMSGTRISTLSKNNPDYLNQIYENQNDWLRSIDENIGYTDNSKYFNETVKDLQNEFSNEGVIDKLFGSSEKKFNNKVNFFMEIDIPDNMKAYEAYAYYNQIKFNIFSKEELSSVRMSVTQRKTGSGYCGLLSFSCGDRYCILDDELGRMDFDNIHDYYNKIQQLTQK